MRVKNLIYHYYILENLLYSLFHTKYGLNTTPRLIPLIVSLTSYPPRFNIAKLAIESILNQTVKPDRIILWLAKEELADGCAPKNLTKLTKRGLEIRIVEENIRSYKKLIYALNEFPESTIITCDDDTLYPRNFIELLYKKFKLCSNNIIAYRCSFMEKTNSSTLKPYLCWPRPQNNQPSLNLFPTGVGGVLYPPKALNSMILYKELFLKLSPLGDDIWFKAMGLLNRTLTTMVYNESVEFPSIKGSQNLSLWHQNITNNKNDEQLKNVFDYFDLYKYIE